MATIITAPLSLPVSRSKVRSAPLEKRRSRDSTWKRRLLATDWRARISGFCSQCEPDLGGVDMVAPFLGVRTTATIPPPASHHPDIPMSDSRPIDTPLPAKDRPLLALHLRNHP